VKPSDTGNINECTVSPQITLVNQRRRSTQTSDNRRYLSLVNDPSTQSLRHAVDPADDLSPHTDGRRQSSSSATAVEDGEVTPSLVSQLQPLSARPNFSSCGCEMHFNIPMSDTSGCRAVLASINSREQTSRMTTAKCRPRADSSGSATAATEDRIMEAVGFSEMSYRLTLLVLSITRVNDARAPAEASDNFYGKRSQSCIIDLAIPRGSNQQFPDSKRYIPSP
jgi:hypothetical protein